MEKLTNLSLELQIEKRWCRIPIDNIPVQNVEKADTHHKQKQIRAYLLESEEWQLCDACRSYGYEVGFGDIEWTDGVSGDGEVLAG